MERLKGIYIGMVPKDMEGKKYDVHWVVENSTTSESGFVSDPVLRQSWMTAGTMKPLPSGTAITFDFDVSRTFDKKQNKMVDKVKVCDIRADRTEKASS